MKRKIIYSSEEDEPTEQTKITLSEVIEIEDDNDNEMDYDERIKSLFPSTKVPPPCLKQTASAFNKVPIDIFLDVNSKQESSGSSSTSEAESENKSNMEFKSSTENENIHSTTSSEIDSNNTEKEEKIHENLSIEPPASCSRMTVDSTNNDGEISSHIHDAEENISDAKESASSKTEASKSSNEIPSKESESSRTSKPKEPAADREITFAGYRLHEKSLDRGGILHLVIDPKPTSTFLKDFPEWFPPKIDEKRPIHPCIVGKAKTVKNEKRKSMKIHYIFEGQEYMHIVSSYCHCCKSATAPRLLCANQKITGCTVVVCARCMTRLNLGSYKRILYGEDEWICCHCRSVCPNGSSCKPYNRILQSIPKSQPKLNNGKRSRKKLKTDHDDSEEELHNDDIEIYDSEEEEEESMYDKNSYASTFSRFKVPSNMLAAVRRQSALALAQFILENVSMPPIDDVSDSKFVDIFCRPVDKVPELHKGIRDKLKTVIGRPKSSGRSDPAIDEEKDIEMNEENAEEEGIIGRYNIDEILPEAEPQYIKVKWLSRPDPKV